MREAQVRIVTAPDADCGGPTWRDAVTMIRSRLERHFGDAVTVEHVTLFSPRFFDLPELAAHIDGGADLPIVLVDGDIISRGGKLSASRISEALGAADVVGTRGR